MKTILFKNRWFRRGLAFYIDGLIVSIFTLIYLFLIDKKGAFKICEAPYCWNIARVSSFQFLFYFLYFLSSEYFFSRTLGKFFLNLKVSIDDKKLIFNVFIRTLIRLFPLNFISIFLEKNMLFWHEKWSSSQIERF